MPQKRWPDALPKELPDGGFLYREAEKSLAADSDRQREVLRKLAAGLSRTSKAIKFVGVIGSVVCIGLGFIALFHPRFDAPSGLMLMFVGALALSSNFVIYGCIQAIAGMLGLQIEILELLRSKPPDA